MNGILLIDIKGVVKLMKSLLMEQKTYFKIPIVKN